MNPTNDPALKSWVPVPPDSHFPIHNLPFGVFERHSGTFPAIGVAIGDHVLDVTYLEAEGLLWVVDSPLFTGESLNLLLEAGPSAWRQVRARVSQLLRADEPILRDDSARNRQALVPMSEVEMKLPVQIGDYTDFYSSRQHATNVGTMLRGPENALMPNWLHLPVAYHGRASSIVVSGTDIRRPYGQTKADDAPAPGFGPSRALPSPSII